MDRQFAASLVIALAASAATSTASACTPAPGWPHDVHLNAEAAAAQMVRAAAFIDVVVAEQFTGDDFEFMSRTREAWLAYAKTTSERQDAETALASERDGLRTDGAARVHFVVREKLKGDGAPEFAFNGSDYAKLAGAPEHPPTAVRLTDLKYLLDQQDYADWDGPGTCTMPIFVLRGRRYLVFRDPRGRVLRSNISVSFHGHLMRIAGPAVVPIETDQDPWLRLVRSKLKRK